MLLTQTILNDGTADTYFVYDKFGRLVFVMPPEGSAIFKTGTPPSAINEDFIQQYCYYYLYDGRGNMIQKHQPGRDFERMFYDSADRLIRYRDGNGDLSGFNGNAGITETYYYLWIDYTYDEYDRITDQVARKQSVMNPIDPNPKYLAKYRYGGALYAQENDSEIKAPFVIPDYLKFSPVDGIVTSSDIGDCNVGLKIYEKLAVIDSTFMQGTTNYVERAFYYDEKGQLIQMVEKNPFGGICRNSTKYDFIGNLLISVESNQLDETLDRIDKTTLYSYDTRGRLLSEKTSINNNLMAAINYEYDDLGQIKTKSFGQGDVVIVDSLHYNMQGNLTKQIYAKGGKTIFESSLRYYNPRYSETKPSFTGNITEWEWMHNDEELNVYSFSYQQGQLTDSKLYQNDANLAINAFTEHVSYDLNGNVLTLQRYGDSSQTPIDKYSFEYEGNQLQNIVGCQFGAYMYDKNGNMTFDARNNLNIKYNILNLPNKVWNSTLPMDIQYKYLADGKKLSVLDNDGNGMLYQGSVVYKSVGGIISLESIAFSGGRIIYTDNGTDGTMVASYYLTDHLGSVRAIVNSSGGIDEQNDYYLFGKRWDKRDSSLSSNRYLFNGKEVQALGNINYLDYGARMYDSEIGRWLTQDPFSQFQSHYLFCANNPVRFIDPNGLWTTVDGGYTTDDEFEIKDFLSGMRSNWGGKSSYDYVENFYDVNRNMKKNIGLYSYSNLTETYATTIPKALIMAKKPWGGWNTQNMNEIQDWQSDFARNFNHYLTMSNPVVKKIHQAQREFIYTALDFSGSVLQYSGNAVAFVGYITAWTGGGLALAGFGESLSAIGSGMSGYKHLMVGNGKAAIYDAASYFTFYGLGKLSVPAKLTEEEAGIFGTILSPFNTVITYGGSKLHD